MTEGLGLRVSLPQPGHIFENKYRIIGLIGSGGFAQVYHAELEDVERAVAIKILTPHDDPDLGTKLYPQEIDARFLREAKMVADLRDPHTITMFDFGRSADGLLYMVFEHIDGRALNQVLFDDGPLPPDLVRSILIQVLRSLREAHAKQILHRDIKPANIMLYDYLGEQSIKVLDFGIAKPMIAPPVGAANYDVTQAGIMMGTPRYMSPEQICGHQMGPGSDIYSLGLVAYELLAGVPAIPETTSPSIVRRQLGPEEFRLPQELPLPSDLRSIIDGMTTKDVKHRFRTTQEVLDLLNAMGGPALGQQVQQEPPTMPLQGLPQDMFRTEGGRMPQPATQQTPTGGGSTQQGLGPQQGFGAPAPGFSNPGFQASPGSQVGFGGPPSTQGGPIAPFGNQGMATVNQPKDTAISIERGPHGVQVVIPGGPRKHSLVLVGAAGLAFFLSITLGFWILILGAGGFALFALGMMFKSATFKVSPAGWELSHTFLTFTTSNSGAVEQFVCLREDVENDRRFLRLISEKKALTVMGDLTPGENAWVSQEVNQYVAQIRGQAAPAN